MFMRAAQVSDTPFTPLRLMQNVIHAERSHLWCYVAATRSAVAAASPVGSAQVHAAFSSWTGTTPAAPCPPGDTALRQPARSVEAVRSA